jgi:hypothetical protein
MIFAKRSATKFAGVALVLSVTFAAGIMAAPAIAAGPETALTFDPVLSLTGNCTTSPTDEVPDPSCPYAPPDQPQAFSQACGVATDSHGDIYVASAGPEASGVQDEGRIDIFDPSGHFLQEIANPHKPCQLAVDSTGALYVLTRPGISEIEKYVPNEYPPTVTTNYGSPMRFEFSGDASGLAIDPSDDHVYVSDVGGIENYAPDGTLAWTIAPTSSTTNFGGLSVWGKNGDIYAAGENLGESFIGKVFVFDGTTHELKLTITGQPSEGGFNFGGEQGRLAVDQATGDVYVADFSGHAVVDRYRGFGDLPGQPGELIEQIRHSFKVTTSAGTGPAVAMDSPVTPGEPGYDSPNAGHLFVTSGASVAHLYAFEPPPATAPPVITDQAVSSITDTEAILQGRVNPHGLSTTYRFEYVTDAQFQASGYADAAVAPVPDGQAGAEPLPRPVSQPISGLTPGTLYHYRLVASNTAGASAGEAGKEAGLSFGTYPSPAGLPDGRAYELVTPPDSNGLVPLGVPFGGAGVFDSATVSPDGESLVYAIPDGEGSLPGQTGNGTNDTYEAVRTPGGWSSSVTSPDGAQAIYPVPGGVSADHRYSFWEVDPYGGSLDFEGLYTRYLRSPDGSFEFAGRGSLGVDPLAVGLYISPDGGNVIFSNDADGDPKEPLESNAPSGINTIYDRAPGGATKVVSLLPGDVTPSAGAAYWMSSEDGSSVLFTITEGGVTTLYERRDDQVTVPIATGAATPVAISGDGDRVFYLEGGDLFACDPGFVGCVGPTGNPPNSVGSGGETQVVNVSADGSHAYFVSGAVLTGAAENDNGEAAKSGADNLYVWSASELRFVAVLAPEDVTGPLNLVNWVKAISGGNFALGAGIDPSRSTPDGAVLIFASHAQLSSTANDGQSEIYRYDGQTGQTECVSCSSTGMQPQGAASLETIRSGAGSNPFGMLSSYAPVTNVTADGAKVFFQSEEPLVLGDSNETMDVYEWEEVGAGGCRAGGPAFDQMAEGCLFLISSGHSPTPSYLYAVSPSGNDVFLRTAATLVPQDTDGGVPSIYDARVGGGFPFTSSPAPCSGESCRPQPVPSPTPSAVLSEAFQGQGNIAAPLTTTPPKAKPKPLTRAQELAKALRACRRDKSKNKREACKRMVSKKYGSKPKVTLKSSSKKRGR